MSTIGRLEMRQLLLGIGLICSLSWGALVEAREACPVFKVGNYGAQEIWYAKFCDGPQFTTLVVPAGTMATNCGGASCVTGLPAKPKMGPKFLGDSRKGYDEPSLFPHSQPISHAIQVSGEETWYLSLGGSKYAKVIRVSYPTQEVDMIEYDTMNNPTTVRRWMMPFRSVYAFEIDKGTLTDAQLIEAEILQPPPSGALKLRRVAFEISDSESIITNVQLKK